MPRLFERDLKELLVFAAMLEGCGYYSCKDDLKRDHVPQTGSEWRDPWQDNQTLEIYFRSALRPPTKVDPRRFALLRYNVKANGSDYYCQFDVCYRKLGQVKTIPESLDWDSVEPAVLQLHFAEPIPPSSCEPWWGNRADFQALELIYLGAENQDSGTDSGEDYAYPDQLAYADDQPVGAIGPDQARRWLEDCFAGRSCELDELCTRRGDYYREEERELLLDCP